MKLTEQFILESNFSMLIDEFPDHRLFQKFYEAKRTEVVLKPGERLFIPAGWFHWVFSETNNDELNVAFNFWYNSDYDIDDIQTSKIFKLTHNLHTELDYIKMLTADNRLYEVSKSDQNFIPEGRMRHRFHGINIDDTLSTFEEFYKEKCKNSYITSQVDERLVKYAPDSPSPNKINSCRWWINWGGGITTGLHADLVDNWIYQISGTKRIILFHPSERDKLYTINPYPPHVIKSLFFRC